MANQNKFVIKLFILQGGTRGLARRNLRSFAASVQHHVSEETHPRITFFHHCVGMDSGEYDATIMPQYIAPLFRDLFPELSSIAKCLGDGTEPVLVDFDIFVREAEPSFAAHMPIGCRIVDKWRRDIENLKVLKDEAHPKRGYVVDLDRALLLCPPMWAYCSYFVELRRKMAARMVQQRIKPWLTKAMARRAKRVHMEAEAVKKNGGKRPKKRHGLAHFNAVQVGPCQSLSLFPPLISFLLETTLTIHP